MGGRNYIMEFIWLWVKALVIYFIGSAILGQLSSTLYGGKEVGIALVLLVFGLQFFNKIVTFNLFGNSDAVIVFWMLKILLSIAIGVIAFPIVNIYYIINIIIQIVKFFSARKYAREEYVDIDE